MSAPFKVEREQWVSSPLPEVFAFFANARNLQVLTPDWLSFEILTPEPIRMTAGVIIDYKLRWHGIPLRWKTEITRWEPPHYFEDLQIKGPYKLWKHSHRFTSIGDGTRISDSVQYALPFGLLGRTVHAISVRHNVEEIFEFRDRKIRALFGSKEVIREPL